MRSAAVKAEDFATEAEPPPPGTPDFTEGPSVMAGMDTASATFTADLDGKYYWVVQLASLDTAPDADAGQNGSGRRQRADADTGLSGDGDMTAETEESIQIEGLMHDTSYQLFVLLTNTAGDAERAVKAVGLRDGGGAPTARYARFHGGSVCDGGYGDGRGYLHGRCGRQILLGGAVGFVGYGTRCGAGQNGSGRRQVPITWIQDLSGDGRYDGRDGGVYPDRWDLCTDTSYQLFVLLTNTAGDAERAVKAEDFATEAEPPPPGTPDFTEGPSVMAGTETAEATFTAGAWTANIIGWCS